MVYLLDASAHDADREAVRVARKKLHETIERENGADRDVLATFQILLKGKVDARRAGRPRPRVRVQMEQQGQAEVVQGAQGSQVAAIIHPYARGGLLGELQDCLH